MLPTVYSIASLPMLYRVSVPWLETCFGSDRPEDVIPLVSKRPSARLEAILEDAYVRGVAAPDKRLETVTKRYEEHERFVLASLEELVQGRLVLFDPIARSDRPEGVCAFAPDNELGAAIAPHLTADGAYFQVGPLLVPFVATPAGLDRHPVLEPLYDADDRVAFPSRADPWSGYVRFNPALFTGMDPGDPYDPESIALVADEARVARALLATRLAAISERRGVSDEIRLFTFSYGVLGKTVEQAVSSGMLAPARFKQIGGRVSTSRRNDRKGLANPAALGLLEAYTLARAPSEERSRVEYQRNAKYPWLLEPVSGRLDALVDSGIGTNEYTVEDVERFGDLAAERGWGITHVAPRLEQLVRDPLLIRDLSDRSSVRLSTLLGSALEPIDPVVLDIEAPVVRPSDANVEPYECLIAHHLRHGLGPAERSSRLAEGLAAEEPSTPSRAEAVENWLDMRDEDLRSFWPGLGRIAHHVYLAPWVVYEASVDLEAATEVPFSVPIETAAGPVRLSMRADVAEASGDTLLVIERKNAYGNRDLAHEHRDQLLLSIAGIEAAYPGRFERAVGIVDANAPYAPMDTGIRPQRFAGFVVDPRGEAVSSLVERSAAIAYARDAMTPERILEERARNEAYREGKRGRRVSPLCSECGWLGRDGTVKGHLGTRWICDSLTGRLPS